MSVYNLGNVVGLLDSVAEPVKKYIIWAKILDSNYPNEIEHRYWDSSVNSWNIFDPSGGFWLGAVNAYNQNTPPGSPALGDSYLIGATPNGAWAGKANHHAKWLGHSWSFIAPLTGATAKDKVLLGTQYTYNGTAWIASAFIGTNYVPLSGTVLGLPVTGDIEVSGARNIVGTGLYKYAVSLSDDYALLRDVSGTRGLTGVLYRNFVASANALSSASVVNTANGIGNYFHGDFSAYSVGGGSQLNFHSGNHTGLTQNGSYNAVFGDHSGLNISGNKNFIAGGSGSVLIAAGSSNNSIFGYAGGSQFQAGASYNVSAGNINATFTSTSLNNIVMGSLGGVTFSGTTNFMAATGGGGTISGSGNAIFNQQGGTNVSGNYNFISGNGGGITVSGTANFLAVSTGAQNLDSNSTGNFIQGSTAVTLINSSRNFFANTGSGFTLTTSNYNTFFSGAASSGLTITGTSYAMFIGSFGTSTFTGANYGNFQVSTGTQFSITALHNMIYAADAGQITSSANGNTFVGAYVHNVNTQSASQTFLGYTDGITNINTNFTGNTYLGVTSLNHASFSSKQYSVITKALTFASTVNSYWGDLAPATLTGNHSWSLPNSSGILATEVYVNDSISAALQGLDWKQSVKAATTGNITLSGAQTIDGVAVGAGDRVLVKDQSLSENNGIYVVAVSSWNRSLDANASDEVKEASVAVQGGTVNAGKQFHADTPDIFVLGTTAYTWVEIGAGSLTYTNGAGLDLTGLTFSVSTNGITNGMLRTSSGLSIVGRATNSTGNVADITGANDQLLRISGGTMAWGTIGNVFISDLAWGKLTGVPTTVAGYGISDGVTLTGAQTLTNKTITSGKYNELLDTTGYTMLGFASTGAANYITVYNGGSTASPKLVATGTDANINLQLEAKGTGTINFQVGTAYLMSLPTTAPTANQLLRYNGTSYEWATVGGASAAGSNTQIQYNNAGAFGAASTFVYTGALGIGVATPEASRLDVRDIASPITLGYTALAHFIQDVNTYAQVNMSNRNAGNSASTDLVLTTDTGTDTVGYLNAGINSSTYNQVAYSIGAAGDSYLYSVAAAGNIGGNLSIGTANAGKVIKLHTGGTQAANQRMQIDGLGNTTWTQGVHTSGAPTGYTFTGAAHTGLTAGTEILGMDFNFSATVQRATGAVTVQRTFLFRAATYSFVGASTITDSATICVTGAPIAGTLATMTRRYAIWAQAGGIRSDGNITSRGVALSVGPEDGQTLALQTNGTGRHTITSTGAHTFTSSALNGTALVTFTQAVSTSGNTKGLVWTGAAHTGQTAGTELIDWDVNLNRTVTFASNTTVTTQRGILFRNPVYNHTTAGGVIVTAATVAIQNAPGNGANTSISAPLSLWIQGGLMAMEGTNHGLVLGGVSRSTSSAALEIASLTAGFLNSRMTTAQFASLSSTDGLQAYVTNNDQGLWGHIGGQKRKISYRQEFSSCMINAISATVSFRKVDATSNRPTSNAGGVNSFDLDPWRAGSAGRVSKISLTVGKAAVSQATVGSTPTVRVDVYKTTQSSRTLIGTYRVVLSPTGVGINTTVADCFQTAILYTGMAAGDAVAEGDLIGAEFVPETTDNNKINAIQMTCLTIEIQ